MLPAVLFDDGQCEIAPLADLRASFDVRIGALTLLERIARLGDVPLVGVAVPPHLEAVTRERHPGLSVNAIDPKSGDVFLINGRWVGFAIKALSEIELHGGYLAEADTEVPLCFKADAADIPKIVRGDYTYGHKERYDPFWFKGYSDQPQAISRPWHFRTFRDAAIDADLQLLLWSKPSAHDVSTRADLHTFGPHPLHISASAKVYPGAVFDRESGPIFIDEHAVIRPGVTIIGPAYIGQNTHILDRALIKGHTAIGPWCKVAGEVGGTVFQGFANKGHDGHLGDSWVGEWANLGAGTTNSNLLNTYAEVTARATPGGRNERTGHQFLGCVIGDHVKTAIGTRIMTGTVVHTGAMLAQSGFVNGCIPPFAWCTDGAGAGVDAATKPQRFRVDKFLDIARTVMARRKVDLSAAYAERLAALHRSSEPKGQG